MNSTAYGFPLYSTLHSRRSSRSSPLHDGPPVWPPAAPTQQDQNEYYGEHYFSPQAEFHTAIINSFKYNCFGDLTSSLTGTSHVPRELKSVCLVRQPSIPPHTPVEHGRRGNTSPAFLPNPVDVNTLYFIYFYLTIPLIRQIAGSGPAGYRERFSRQLGFRSYVVFVAE